MQFTTFIVAALAATVAAENAPYKLAKKSANLVTLVARSEPGYQPEEAFCGAGDTCAEACGSTFAQCASTDGLAHCFDTGAGETCCGNDNGTACENGYYCAVDSEAETWCCPEGMTAAECAAEYSVDGGLTSQIPTATSTYNPAATGGANGPGNGTASDPTGPSNTGEASPIATGAAGSLIASGTLATIFALAASFL